MGTAVRDAQSLPQIICTGELWSDVSTCEELLHCRSQDVPRAVQASSPHNFSPIAVDEHAANRLAMETDAVA